MAILQKVANRQKKLVEIDLSDLSEHFSQVREAGFVERIWTNTVRYVDLFSEVIDKLMPPPSVAFQDSDFKPEDILMQQRRFNH